MYDKIISSIKRQSLPIQQFILLAVLFPTPLLASIDTMVFDINRNGRKIQHDGFLMEWRMKNARFWDDSGIWVWDATITPEGLAGYISSRGSPSCKHWTFTGISTENYQLHQIILPPDSLSQGNIFRMDREEYIRSGRVIIEWLFPFKNISSVKHDPIKLILTGTSCCGDTLPFLQLTSIMSPVNKNAPKKLVGQGLFIIVLALVYIALKKKIRRQMQQRGFPRR